MFRVQVKIFINESVKYIILSHCGFDASLHFDDDNFTDLYAFDTKDIMLEVAKTISHISKETLSEIENIVKSERNKYYEYNNAKEKNNQWNTTLAVQRGYDLRSLR